MVNRFMYVKGHCFCRVEDGQDRAGFIIQTAITKNTIKTFLSCSSGSWKIQDGRTADLVSDEHGLPGS